MQVPHHWPGRNLSALHLYPFPLLECRHAAIQLQPAQGATRGTGLLGFVCALDPLSLSGEACGPFSE